MFESALENISTQYQHVKGIANCSKHKDQKQGRYEEFLMTPLDLKAGVKRKIQHLQKTPRQ